MIQRAILGFAMAVLFAAPASADPTFTMFDVPGSTSTSAAGIDDSGTVAGSYTTAKGRCRGGCGYTRTADGTFSTFQVPGCDILEIRSTNAAGDMAGFCNTEHSAFSFIRLADGTITRVKNMKGSTATLNTISANDMVGGYFYSVYGAQPFLRLPDGSKHLLEGIKKQVGSVDGASPSGLLTGAMAREPSVPAQGFIYTLGEKVQEFSVPGFAWSDGTAINDAGDVAGVCANTNPIQPPQGFVRNADGTFETFDLGVKEDGSVGISAIVTVGSDREVIGRAAKDGDDHWFSFIRHGNGTIETFDVSGNEAPYGGTVIAGANASGVIVGSTIDHHGRPHAFIRTPTP
jgi:hypothetical protein